MRQLALPFFLAVSLIVSPAFANDEEVSADSAPAGGEAPAAEAAGDEDLVEDDLDELPSLDDCLAKRLPTQP